MSKTDIRIVLVSVPNEETGAAIATPLIEQGLAACVSVVPKIRSIYRWQGKIEDETEALLIFKSTAARYPELERAIVAAHPYDVPEVLALATEDGFENYCAWVLDSTKQS